MPIVFTETGMDTRYGQRHQAETLMKKMSYASAIGAKGYTWYNLMDRAGGEDSHRPGHTYGLLTNPTGTGNFAEIEDRNTSTTRTRSICCGAARPICSVSDKRRS
jgi:hypothetical protein